MNCSTAFNSYARIAAIVLVSVSLFFVSGRECRGQVRIETLEGRTSLSGPWKIMTADDRRFATLEFDDSAWDTVSLPGSMVSYVIKKTGSIQGVLWLRKVVYIDRALSGRDIGLILGRIGGADETYFNGVKIGSMGKFPPEAHSMWNHPRYYMAIQPCIRYGGINVIAVRVSYYILCEVLGTLEVTGAEDWEAASVTGRFLLIDLSYICIAMGLGLLFISLFFFIARPASQEYLYYCLQLLCGLFIVLEYCTHWDLYGSLLTRFKINGFAWVAVNVAHPIFLHRFYDLKRKKIELVLWAYLAIVGFIALFFVGDADVRTGGIILILFTLLIGPYNISCHISALVKRRPYAKHMSIFGIIVVIGAFHDGLVYLIKFTGCDPNRFGPLFQYMIFQYASAALFVGTALVLVVRFVNVSNEVEDLNTSLENFLIENTLLNERLKDSGESLKRGAYPVISDGAEEKVRQVIDYINENYTFDISREGLAATVDVHPDSLGKLFKSFTNKKLGEYINELRVKEAARKLVETDETIINIAFSVGFDSLRTFNRVFPRFMKMTPEKYRAQHKP